MNRAYSRINWENEPSTATPINDENLNAMDLALYTVDGRVVEFDTTKADESDLLTALSDVSYNSTTGVFTFTWKNGTTYTVDLNIEQIPVSFSMDSDGVITMTTADGTEYTADVSSLIKTYTMATTSEITWTTTTDSDGNKTFTPALVDGGIASSKLETNFLANCQDAQSGAESAEAEAEADALVSEGYAKGTQNGTEVTSESVYYHNNAKYYSEVAGSTSLSSLSDVSISGATSGEVLKFNGTSWENDSVDASEVTYGSSGVDTTLDTIVNTTIPAIQSAIITKSLNLTIASGATTYTISDSYIHVGSILDIYAEDSSRSILQAADASFTVSEGKVTMTFSNATTADAVLGAIVINNSLV